MRSAKYVDMCSGPVLRKMIVFTLPIMFSGLFQLLFNATDIIVVGRFAGDNALAAVGSNTALINLMTNLFIGISIGANVVAARYCGAKNYSELNRTVHTSMLLSVISGFLLMAAGLLFAEQILGLMSTPESILGMASDYLRLYFCGMPFMMIYNFGNALLRAAGDTRRPLIYLICVDTSLEQRMEIAQKLTSMVLSLRRKVNIKVRQPLSTIMVPVADDTMKAVIESIAPLVLTEINVKDLKLVHNGDGVLVKRVKPDFKVLGKKLGKQMKAAAQALGCLSQQQIASLEADGHIDLDIDGATVRIESADVEIISEDIPGWLVANDGNLTVALDITVTDDLRREGIAREIVNRVQNIRKDRNYDITDRISLVFAPADGLDGVLADYSAYISSQVLADAIAVDGSVAADAAAEDLDIDGQIIKVKISQI